MITLDGKKLTAKQMAAALWLHHLEGTCAWTEWIDEVDAESLTGREAQVISGHMTKMFHRMIRLLEKSAPGLKR